VIRVYDLRLKGLTVTSLEIMARSRLRDERPKQNGNNSQIRAKQQAVFVSRRPREPQTGILRVGNFIIPCALGKGGIGTLKREGDGKTPFASMNVLFGFYRTDRWPVMARSPWMLPVAHDLGWCDAPHDQNYNRAVLRPYPASHETLARGDGLYDCVIVLNWNVQPRARNCGSAIFIHIARDGYKPTEGCIAVSRLDMIRLVKVLTPKTLVRTLA
jgi:L,D-peptidoglycan transpeptidase YkuD (ErfK/YbiS/YcfS/YnhG family)